MKIQVCYRANCSKVGPTESLKEEIIPSAPTGPLARTEPQSLYAPLKMTVDRSNDGLSFLSKLFPSILSIIVFIRVDDIKQLYLALDSSEDQEMMLWAFTALFHNKWHYNHLRHDTESGKALRFMFTLPKMKLKQSYSPHLPEHIMKFASMSYYWTFDLRWLIENLQYDEALSLLEVEDLTFSLNKPTAYAGKTALHLAAERGQERLVRALCMRGASVSAEQNYGWTALHYAAYYDCAEVVMTLLEFGADVNARTNDGKCSTPLHLTTRFEESNCVLPLLMAPNIEVNKMNSQSETPLDKAMIFQGLETTPNSFLFGTSPYQLFPPSYMERQGISLGREWRTSEGPRRRHSFFENFRAYFRINTTDNNVNVGKKEKEGDDDEDEKQIRSDLAILSALAAAAAAPPPPPPPPGAPPLPCLKEVDEAEEIDVEGDVFGSLRCHQITANMIKSRKVLRNTIHQLKSCSAKSADEIKRLSSVVYL